MWGFYNERNRVVANTIFESITDKNISLAHKKNNEFGQDQIFPRKYIYPLIQNMTMTHDSYFCQKFAKISVPTNMRSFSVRRDGACWIGIWYSPNLNCKAGNTTIFKCPDACRPANHKDWIHC